MHWVGEGTNSMHYDKINYIVNACWSSEVKTAGSIQVRSLEGVTKLCILSIYQKDVSI
jgi:hypothetical protein